MHHLLIGSSTHHTVVAGLVALLLLGFAPASAEDLGDANLSIHVIVETLELTPDMIEAAELSDELSSDGTASLQLKLSPEAASRMAAFTRENIGRQVTFVVADRILSKPVIRAEIEGGRLLLTGVAQSEAEALVKIWSGR